MKSGGILPEEILLRGGRYLPTADLRCCQAPQQQHGYRSLTGFGNLPKPLVTGGNPPRSYPGCWCVDRWRPGQGLRSHFLGFACQGNRERVMRWLVVRSVVEQKLSSARGITLGT